MSENLQYFYCAQCSQSSLASSEKEVDLQFSNNYSLRGCICKQKNLNKEENFSWDQTSTEEESDVDFKDLYTLYRNFF